MFKKYKTFSVFQYSIETRVEVWENEKLQWEHEHIGRMFPRNFVFSQTFIGTRGNVLYFFYKITRGKLKRGNSLIYQSVNSPYCSRRRMRWRIMAPSHVYHVYTVIETRLLASQSSHFQNVIL